jgi:hypothetical protein
MTCLDQFLAYLSPLSCLDRYRVAAARLPRPAPRCFRARPPKPPGPARSTRQIQLAVGRARTATTLSDLQTSEAALTRLALVGSSPMRLGLPRSRSTQEGRPTKIISLRPVPEREAESVDHDSMTLKAACCSLLTARLRSWCGQTIKKARSGDPDLASDLLFLWWAILGLNQ